MEAVTNDQPRASEAVVLTQEALDRTRAILHESEELLERVKDISRTANQPLQP
jgi:hypothetical protein